MTENRAHALGVALLCATTVVGVVGCGRPAEEPSPRPNEPAAEREGGDPSSRALAQLVGRRLALVVGNESYAESPLFNPVNDARAVSAALTDVGFSVTRLEDATRMEMASAITTFAATVHDDDVALFYYAGHGMQVDMENYLIPTDYRGRSEAAARLQGISASEVQDALASARVAMLVFDACRNNPYRGTRGGAGLAPMEARGTLIAYAAGAGEQASDEPEAENGLFTAQFLSALREPGLTATELFQRVRREVHAASKERQWPAVYNDLLADFVFREPASSLADATETPSGERRAAETRLEAETVFWQSIVNSTNPADMEAYLNQFPTGVYAPLARNRLEASRLDVQGNDRPRSGPSAAEGALGLDRAARRLMQEGLRAEGFDPGSVDGLFGTRTRTAVRAWQAARSVAATGYLDAEEAAALRHAAERAARSEQGRRQSQRRTATATPTPRSQRPAPAARPARPAVYLAGYSSDDVREFDWKCSRVHVARDPGAADFVLERTGGSFWGSESAVLWDGQRDHVRRFSAALQGNLFDDVCESF